MGLIKGQPIEFGTTRRAFFKNVTMETRKEKRIYWRAFNAKREELVANFFHFREYIIPAVSTEISLILQLMKQILLIELLVLVMMVDMQVTLLVVFE